jgi:hypothetical protein
VTSKILSFLFATAALAGAVIYAQQKAQKSPRKNPVFDTSKSGTPTPIDATDAEKDAIRKQNEHHNHDKQTDVPAQGQQASPAQSNTPKQNWPEPTEPGKKKRKKVMPSSKSYIPE